MLQMLRKEQILLQMQNNASFSSHLYFMGFSSIFNSPHTNLVLLVVQKIQWKASETGLSLMSVWFFWECAEAASSLANSFFLSFLLSVTKIKFTSMQGVSTTYLGHLLNLILSLHTVTNLTHCWHTPIVVSLLLPQWFCESRY